MAEPIENKRSLIDRLEKDRQRMAVRVCELKREYNVADQLRAFESGRGLVCWQPVSGVG